MGRQQEYGFAPCWGCSANDHHFEKAWGAPHAAGMEPVSRLEVRLMWRRLEKPPALQCGGRVPERLFRSNSRSVSFDQEPFEPHLRHMACHVMPLLASATLMYC